MTDVCLEWVGVTSDRDRVFPNTHLDKFLNFSA
jgi:hypothetical protein